MMKGKRTGSTECDSLNVSGSLNRDTRHMRLLATHSRCIFRIRDLSVRATPVSYSVTGRACGNKQKGLEQSIGPTLDYLRCLVPFMEQEENITFRFFLFFFDGGGSPCCSFYCSFVSCSFFSSSSSFCVCVCVCVWVRTQ